MGLTTAIAVCGIWAGVGLLGFATSDHVLIAVASLFAMFATGIVAGKDQG
jgi:hypothetical protein